jgi:hypothetical protein
MIVWPERADARVHSDLVADRTIDDGNRGEGRGAARPRGHPACGHRKDHRQVFRLCARHHGVDRDPFNIELPKFAECGRAQLANHPVARDLGALEHRLDAFFGRQHDRQEIRPAITQEHLLEVFFGVGLQQPRRGADQGRRP